MKVLICTPKSNEIHDISFKQIKKLVGGTISIAKPSIAYLKGILDKQDCIIYDKSAITKTDKAPNVIGTTLYNSEYITTTIHGIIVIASYNSNYEIESLPDERAKKYKEIFDKIL